MKSIEEAAEVLRSHAKTRAGRRIGFEYERFAIHADGAPATFDSDIEPSFRAWAERFGWALGEESGRVVYLERAGETIALEPGGQVEIVTRPEDSPDSLARALERLVEESEAVFAPRGLRLVGAGTHPTRPAEGIGWVPKGRYRVMRDVLSKTGDMGIAMMKATCGIQAAFDYTSEAEGMEMLRAALLIGPVSRAIFANASTYGGHETGWATYRAEIWNRTDPARTGFLPYFQEEGRTFLDYARWVAACPLLFLESGGGFVSSNGVCLSDRLSSGATLYDFESALTQVFPFARIKHFVEVRPDDSLPPERVPEMVSFWTGLLYGDRARARAIRLLAARPPAAREELAQRGARRGLADAEVAEAASELRALSNEGLKELVLPAPPPTIEA